MFFTLNPFIYIQITLLLWIVGEFIMVMLSSDANTLKKIMIKEEPDKLIDFKCISICTYVCLH